jgi:amino acid transporter
MMIRGMLWTGLVCLVVLTLGGWFFHSERMAWSVLVGGLLTLVSFALSIRGVKKLADGVVETTGGEEELARRLARGREETRKCILGFFVRLLVMALILFPLIRHKWVEVFGLIIGLSVVPLAVLVIAVVMAGRHLLHGR